MYLYGVCDKCFVLVGRVFPKFSQDNSYISLGRNGRQNFEF